ncbi:MAG: recombinase family protein [Hyphomicrobiaceae bacterium]|nr:MAG: recombinase family protein [Hyphomicrobiaceae bacterium]
MTKITTEHLSRNAIVYIRQSTPGQVANNLESKRRQYGLADRARQLGWQEVTVIDDDQGHSGSGMARAGFEKLLVAVAAGQVGTVVSIEASRLARNGRDWHTLLEFCGFVGTLIIDEDGVYDPRHPNDRLLLGLKGTMSEMELSVLRQRAHEAQKLKATRGELFMTVAVGYRKVANEDRIEKEPDRRVQQAIELVFKKFDELQSARQVHRWLRQENISLPTIAYGPEGRHVIWKLPTYTRIHSMLTNPIYAGAYSWGRSTHRVRIEEGRKRISRGHRRARAEWPVFIADHHEGYISWGQYERNQRVMADNANSKRLTARGSIRRGSTLLNGLLRCGHCGRKLSVGYGKGSSRYYCHGRTHLHGGKLCISFGALRVDESVSAEVLRQIQPMGVEAALSAIEARESETNDVRRQVELALEQARYESNRAQRQYHAVDPENRIVAAELERLWNERLLVVRQLETKLQQVDTQHLPPLSQEERAQLLALGSDLERAWKHPAATAETRKRILRAVIIEIVARLEGNEVHLVLHWQGGDHSELKVHKPRNGEHRWTLDATTTDIIRELARLMPDLKIAALLNRAGKRTGQDNTWTEPRVRAFRNDHGIAVYREGERAERGELTLLEAAAALGTCQMTVLRLIRKGSLDARQVCKGAPWVIRASALADLKLSGIGRRRPLTANPDQKSLQF